MADDEMNKVRFHDDPFPSFQWYCALFPRKKFTPTLDPIPENENRKELWPSLEG